MAKRKVAALSTSVRSKVIVEKSKTIGSSHRLMPESEYQTARILLVEDDESRCAWFRKRFAGRTIDLTCDASQAIAWLTERKYSIILLDHDLLDEHYFSDAPDDERTGYAVAAFLARHSHCQREAAIIIHSLNYHGAARMLEALRDAGRVAEHIPFPLLVSELRF